MSYSTVFITVLFFFKMFKENLICLSLNNAVDFDAVDIRRLAEVKEVNAVPELIPCESKAKKIFHHLVNINN